MAFDLKALGNLASPIVHRAASVLLREPATRVLDRVKARFAGTLPVPGQDDLGTALRLAGHAATLIVLEHARQQIAGDAFDMRAAEEPAFFKATEAWIAGESNLNPFAKVPDGAGLVPVMDGVLDRILAGGNDDAAFRAAMRPVEEVAWREVTARVDGAGVPEEVGVCFRGDGMDAPGWSALFLALMQESLRTHPRVQVDFISSRLGALRTEMREGFAQMPEAVADALWRKFQREGLGEVGRDKLLLLAQRLSPEAITNLDRAHDELKPAVDAYLEAQTRPAFVRNQGGFLTGVLERIARLNEANDFDAGRREVDAALAELERQSRERRAAERRQREELIEAGIRQDTIRGDAEGVACWEEALIGLRHGARRPT